MYDNHVLQLAGMTPREGNTVALTMVINVILTNSLELLNKGFELELYALHELAMIFSYLKYLYMLLILNRKSMVLGMAGEEITKYGLLNLDDLCKSADKFKSKRRKFSAAQKLACDEFELFKALQKVFTGMTMMMYFFEKEGIIKNVIHEENVEK